MATFTTETVTTSVCRWIIPAAEPRGAAAAEIGAAWTAAENSYREHHGLDDAMPVPGDALTFHATDDAIVISFTAASPQPRLLPAVAVGTEDVPGELPAQQAAGNAMDRRSWYMPKQTADALADAVETLHYETRQPKHAVLAELVAVALENLPDIQQRLRSAP